MDYPAFRVKMYFFKRIPGNDIIIIWIRPIPGTYFSTGEVSSGHGAFLSFFYYERRERGSRGRGFSWTKRVE
jgi:hypothetical protein